MYVFQKRTADYPQKNAHLAQPRTFTLCHSKDQEDSSIYPSRRGRHAVFCVSNPPLEFVYVLQLQTNDGTDANSENVLSCHGMLKATITLELSPPDKDKSRIFSVGCIEIPRITGNHVFYR